MPAWSSILDSLSHARFKDAANYLFLDQSDVDTSNQADSQLERITRDRFGEGKITKDDFDLTTARVQQNAFPFVFSNKDLSPLDGFEEGALDGLRSGQEFARRQLSSGADFIFGSIPWQIYLIAGIVGAFYAFTFFRKK